MLTLYFLDFGHWCLVLSTVWLLVLGALYYLVLLYLRHYHATIRSLQLLLSFVVEEIGQE